MSEAWRFITGRRRCGRPVAKGISTAARVTDIREKPAGHGCIGALPAHASPLVLYGGRRRAARRRAAARAKMATTRADALGAHRSSCFAQTGVSASCSPPSAFERRIAAEGDAVAAASARALGAVAAL